jgi:hypothetical protein
LRILGWIASFILMVMVSMGTTITAVQTMLGLRGIGSYFRILAVETAKVRAISRMGALLPVQLPELLHGSPCQHSAPPERDARGWPAGRGVSQFSVGASGSVRGRR